MKEIVILLLMCDNVCVLMKVLLMCNIIINV